MLRRVQLKDILEDNYDKQTGDYILVNTVWNSGIPKEKSKQKRCRFIFWDGGNFIVGTLFLLDGKNVNARNMFQKLQNKTCTLRIKNFKVEENVNLNWRLLREQSKQIILSKSTCDVERVTYEDALPIIKYLPLQITKLDEVDNCSKGAIIDVIGVAKEISKLQKSNDGQTNYKKTTIGSSRSSVPSKTGFERDIALFGDCLTEIRKKGSVYAFLNVKVEEWANNKSLQTTGNTIIMKVESSEDLPPNHCDDDELMGLLPRKRTIKRARSEGCTRTDTPYSPTLPGYLTSPELSQNVRQLFSPAGSSASHDDSEFLNSLISNNGNNSNRGQNLPSTSKAVKSLRFSENKTGLETPNLPTHPGTVTAEDCEPKIESTDSNGSTSEISNSSNSTLETPSQHFSSSEVPPLTTLNSNEKASLSQCSTNSNKHSGLFKVPYACHPIFGTSGFRAPEFSSHSSNASLNSSVPGPSHSKTQQDTQKEKITKKRKISQPRPSFPKYIYDFKESEDPLEVHDNTKLSKVLMDTTDNTYRMRSEPRGIALIINNYCFPEKEDDGLIRDIREGSHHDVEYLMEILSIFKFTVVLKQNLSVNNISSVLENFKKRATANMDACFVAILTHGHHGLVEMVDGLVRLPNDIIHQFDESAFPVFAGKPKIFLIQACQPVPLDIDTITHVKALMPNREEDLELENMIEIYSAVPGTFASRDLIIGSPLIYIFVDILAKHAHDTDLETILNWVQYNLANNVRQDGKGKLHCTWIKHGFTKKLFFNPGLPSSTSTQE